MSRDRSIPSLDGLRALAVMSVIFSHSSSNLWVSLSWLKPIRNAGLGVTCFFVISGLLITKLILNELDITGTISIRSFYARRFFRIFPPFYVYLLVVGLLALFHVVPCDLKSFVYAAVYVRNYAPHPFVLLLGHTWSLSLEEQFYLMWPAFLFFFSPRTCLKIAGVAILLSPLLRIATYALVPSMRDHINLMLHTRLDAIMVGAFISLAQHQKVFTRTLAFISKPACLIPAGAYFVAQPFLDARYQGAFTLPFGFLLDALMCGVVILFATSAPRSVLGRMLNVAWLRHLGVISYGIYLWQQMFTAKYTILFPLNLVPILLCAEASYWLIEKPSLRLKNRLIRPSPAAARVIDNEALELPTVIEAALDSPIETDKDRFGAAPA
jgi:peptidoglycan/LPS O-acetylase OafA/YrhL